ncbi:hypothetical protein [Seonamhaeicola aphaedonensis]|uniref:Lipoprotein n=1 Tax=Seonamhaeicola aphaedonensis TaxID=1461338 RepID=A0A3D9HMH5_9FLAO|nr:hypothetical protein [Seonamhaeicola aphaedonensis]RED50679.1 hypothetical protein DFQ02_101716 [Seonamhaeicola aphaedonensis]
MSRLFFSALCLTFVLFSCKNSNENEGNLTTKKDNQEITEKDISNIDYIEFLLDEKTEKHTNNWLEYKQIQEIISNIKKGDLTFLYDNRAVVDSTLTELKLYIPEPLNSPSISARINAFETKMLKLESIYNLNTTKNDELLEALKDFFIAFSNLNLQMNKKVEFDNLDIQKP